MGAARQIKGDLNKYSLTDLELVFWHSTSAQGELSGAMISLLSGQQAH